MGRPKLDKTCSDRRQELTLESYPVWLTYEDVQTLLRLYRGKGYGRKLWNTLVATKQIPAYQDPWGGHIRYKWDEVRQAIDNAMVQIG